MSQLKTIANKIKEFFDGPLRNSLKYGNFYEAAKIDINNDTISLIDNLTYNYYINKLYDILMKNKSLIEEIRKNIESGIIKSYPEIKGILMELPNPKEIKFTIIRNPFPLQDVPEIGIKVNIASNLKLFDLVKYCSTNTELCRSSSFWSGLFNIRYPGYPSIQLNKILKLKDIDFEKLYKGLLYIEENVIELEKKLKPLPPVQPVQAQPLFMLGIQLPNIQLANMGQPISNLRTSGEFSRDMSFDKLARIVQEYPDAFGFSIYIGLFPEILVDYQFNKIMELSELRTWDIIYNKYPELFNEDALYSLEGSIKDDPKIENPLEKILWINRKLNKPLGINELLGMTNEVYSDTLIKEIVDYLSEDININIIINKINDITTNYPIEERYVAKLLFNRYKYKFNKEELIELIDAII